MSISQRRLSKEEIARRGDEIYVRDVRPILTSDDHGKFIAIDVESGAFELDNHEIAATEHLRARVPEAQVWLTRVGFGFVRRNVSPRHVPSS